MNSETQNDDAEYGFERPKVYSTRSQIARLVPAGSKLGDFRTEREAETMSAAGSSVCTRRRHTRQAV
jgi:hypothetical protein